MPESLYRPMMRDADGLIPSTICDQFQAWAKKAVDEWDGQSNADLMELIRNEFGQTIHQFYGLMPTGDTWRHLADCRERLAAFREDVRTTLTQMDQLAEVWGDEGVFRRCRDRLRNLVG
jgi:hypothetical protein